MPANFISTSTEFLRLSPTASVHSFADWHLDFGLCLGDDLAGLRAIVEAANRDTGSFWFRSRWLLGIFERDFDAVISFLDEMPDDVLGIDTRARFYATTYQLAGQPDLAEPYFEVAKEYLEQQLADQYFPEFRSRWLMNLAEITAGLGKFDEVRRLAEESMAMKFPDEPAVTKQLLSAAALGVFIPAGDHDRAIELEAICLRAGARCPVRLCGDHG